MKLRACCIAIDIKGSEDIRNKDDLIKQLKDELNDINRKYDSSLVIPFESRRGDEFIGVSGSFSDGYSIYRDFEFICEELGIKTYLGMGLGVVDTDLDFKINFLYNNNTLLDSFGKFRSEFNLDSINGSAIISAFRARDKFLKNPEEFVNKEETNILESSNNVSVFVYNNEKEIPFQVINYLIYEVNNHWHNCSDLQKQALRIYEKSGYNISYKDIGVKLNYEKNPAQNARSVLKNAHADLYKHKIQMVYEMLLFAEKNYRY